MSGGVDSSVAAALLVRRGFRVVGFTLKLWDAEDDDHARKVCCAAVMARDARRVCAILGVPHYTLDRRDEFRRGVVEPFEQSYLRGETPNPCVWCNSRVKWKTLMAQVNYLGLDWLATGHYARTELHPDGTVRLLRARSATKDQSYFLWQIPPQLLRRTLFPLGNLDKPKVRALAAELGLPVADKEESQEVCFVPGDDYRAWLVRRRPEMAAEALAGEVVDRSGKVLGRHSGYPFFTIGQRKGLGLGGGPSRRFVTAIQPSTRRVVVGSVDELERTNFKVGAMNVLSPSGLVPGNGYVAKIRYRDPGAPVRVAPNSDGTWSVTAEIPFRAVTPGQSAVFYQGEEVIAGGIILPESD